MIDLVEELRKIRNELQAATTFSNDYAYMVTINSLLTNAKAVGKAWCGSWYGYQAYVYYKNFDSPPAGTNFDHRWGFEVDLFGESRKKSSWSEYSYDQVMGVVKEGIESTDIDNMFEHTRQWIYEFKNKKEDVIDIIKIAQESNRSYYSNLLDRTEKLKVLTVDEIIASDRPIEMATKDPIAIQQGFRTPPHIQVIAEVHWSIRAAEAINKLGKIVEKTIAQMERTDQRKSTSYPMGENIFIGHGRSNVWLKLEKFLKERLNQKVDEFNRVSTQVYTISIVSNRCWIRQNSRFL